MSDGTAKGTCQCKAGVEVDALRGSFGGGDGSHGV